MSAAGGDRELRLAKAAIKAARTHLERWGWRVFDPMDRDYRGREDEPGIAALIVEPDLMCGFRPIPHQIRRRVGPAIS